MTSSHPKHTCETLRAVRKRAATALRLMRVGKRMGDTYVTEKYREIAFEHVTAALWIERVCFSNPNAPKPQGIIKP